MILRAEEIASRIESGRDPDASDPLAISPCPDLDDLRLSGAASVDLRLGTWFVSLRPERMPYMPIGNGSPEAQVSKTRYVPFSKKYYLHPGRFVLAVTLEWIRLPASIGGSVIGKSSWGRRGLVIATATAVHPRFAGCLTLELANLGELPIELQPGATICQLALHEVDGTLPHGDKSQFVGLRGV